MNPKRGVAWLLLVAFIFLLAFICGAAVYWRLSSNFVKAPLATRLQIDYQLESALVMVYQTIAESGLQPLPATFTYEPPRREIMPGVTLSVLTAQRKPEEVLLDAWAVGSRVERHLSARIFLGIASAPEVAESPNQAIAGANMNATDTVATGPISASAPAAPPVWLLEMRPRRPATP